MTSATQSTLRPDVRISFRQLLVYGMAQRTGALRDRALWIFLAVVGLSLVTSYVMVLRGAVSHGHAVRAQFHAQQGPTMRAASLPAPEPRPLRTASAQR